MKFKLFFFLSGAIVCCASLGFSQNVGINTTTPHSANALDVKPVGFQGFAPPRFSGNVNGSFGLTGVNGVGTLYYDTLNQVYRYYAGGGSWLTFGGASSGLSGSGVAGRVPFWDGATSLSSNGVFVWDNVNSRLGIGQSTPLAKVDILNSVSASESSLRISNTNNANSSSLIEANTNGNGPGFNLSQTGWGVGVQVAVNNNSSSSTVFTANTTGSGIVLDAQKSGTSVFRAESTGDVYISRAFKPGNNAGTVGQILVSDGAGSAPKWVTPAMSGSGITNYVARWTSASALSTGIIQDNGTHVGVNSAPSAGAGRMYVIAGVGNVPAIRGESTDGANANNTAILGMAGYGSSSSTGIRGMASWSANVKAIDAWATGEGGGYAYGMYSRVDGKADFTYGYYATVMPQTGKAYGVYASLSGASSLAYGIYADVSSVTTGSAYSAAFMGGHVGIGTDAPEAPLDVKSDSATNYFKTTVLANAIGDKNFNLYTSKGETTNNTGDVVLKLGMDYANGLRNTGINFHRGAANQGGFMSFSTNDDKEKMRLTPDGRLGIGTDAPNELLDVEGSVEIDGEYRYESPKDRIFTIPGNSFNLVNVNATNVKVVSDVAENGMSVSLKDGGAGLGELYAPINLPSGATLHSVQSFVFDDDNLKDMFVTVYKKDFGTSNPPIQVGITGQSTGSKYQWVIVGDLNEVIDNKKFYYYVRVRMSEGSFDHRLFSTTLLHSVQSAD